MVSLFTEQSLLNADKLFYTENKGAGIISTMALGCYLLNKLQSRYFGELFLSNPDRGGAQVTLLIKNNLGIY